MKINLQGNKENCFIALGPGHRYQKSKIDSLRFVMCPLLVPVFQRFFFAVAINSTNESNKAGGMHL